MTRNQKVGYIVVWILGALLLGVGIGLWGWGVFPFYIAIAIGLRIELECQNKVTKLYWRTKPYDCSNCGKPIPANQDLILTSQTTGYPVRHYDTVECMREDVEGLFK